MCGEHAMGVAGIRSAQNIHLSVVGYIPNKLLTDLQARFPSVVFEGYVEDLPSYVSNCRIGVVPDVVGGGFKVRLLTYAFLGVPMYGIEGNFSDVRALR